MSGPISYAETRISSLQRRTTKNEEIHDRHAWPVFADRSGRCVVRPPGRSCTEDREEKEDQQEEKRYKEGRRTGEVVVVATFQQICWIAAQPVLRIKLRGGPGFLPSFPPSFLSPKLTLLSFLHNL